MIVLIDNYDSFTFNLVHYLGELGAEVAVHRNDKVSAGAVIAADPDAIVLSPGPCTPNEAGICLDVIAKASPTIPIFGVCLGHQAIAAAFGARVEHASELMHGITSLVHHDDSALYAGLPDPFAATRYHSLAIVPESLPPALVVSSRTDSGVIMGVRHRTLPIEGVQFHPESVLTEGGYRLLGNWLETVGIPDAATRGASLSPRR